MRVARPTQSPTQATHKRPQYGPRNLVLDPRLPSEKNEMTGSLLLAPPSPTHSATGPRCRDPPHCTCSVKRSELLAPRHHLKKGSLASARCPSKRQSRYRSTCLGMGGDLVGLEPEHLEALEAGRTAQGDVALAWTSTCDSQQLTVEADAGLWNTRPSQTPCRDQP